MLRQLLVADAVKFDADPATHSKIWRSIEFLRRLFDEHLLNSDSGWNYYRHVPIVVMINRASRKHFFPDKEGRLTVRQFFPRPRQGKANAPNSLHLGFFSSVSLG